MTYNLDDNAAESFDFKLGEHVYDVKYPTTDEVLEVQKINDQDKQLEWIYKLITPRDPKSPSIKELIGKSNVRVLAAFNNMLKDEFGGLTAE